MRAREKRRGEGPVLATEDDRGGFCVAAGPFASFHARVDVLYHRASSSQSESHFFPMIPIRPPRRGGPLVHCPKALIASKALVWF